MIKNLHIIDLKVTIVKYTYHYLHLCWRLCVQCDGAIIILLQQGGRTRFMSRSSLRKHCMQSHLSKSQDGDQYQSRIDVLNQSTTVLGPF